MKTISSYTQKNYQLGVVNGLLNILAEALFDPTLVLVAFLSHLTQSPLLLGLIVPLRDGTWSLPQFWVSGILQSRKQKISFYKQMAIFRGLSWLGLALSINLITDTGWLLLAFFVFYGSASLASGLSGLPFLEVIGKTIHPRRRGEFFAWRLGLGGLISILASLLVRWLLDPHAPIQFPHNFGILSILYFVIGCMSVLTFCQVKEQSEVEVSPVPSLKDQFSSAVKFMKSDPTYRRFIAMQSTLLMGGGATPFFAVFVQQQLGGPPAMVGVYLAVIMVTNLVANLIFGRVSNRLGNNVVMRFGTIAGMVMATWVFAMAMFAGPLDLSGQAASNLLVPVFVLTGIRGTAIGVAGNSLLLDISPQKGRSIYMGFTNSLLGIVLFGTALSGVLLALLGYKILFFLIILLNVYAFISASRIRRPAAVVYPGSVEYLP